MQISMANTNFDENMNKVGVGGSSVHPEGKFDFRIVAIEYNEIKTVKKSNANDFLYFHLRSVKGLQTFYCSLAPTAGFNLANIAKATKCMVSNSSTIYYTGLVGRVISAEVVHEEKVSDQGKQYKVSNIKKFDYSSSFDKLQQIDLSNPQLQNLPAIFKNYKIEVREQNQGFDNFNSGGQQQQQNQTNPFSQPVNQQSVTQPATIHDVQPNQLPDNSIGEIEGSELPF